MQISINLSSNHDVIVALSGEFDAHGCQEIRDELESAAKQCRGGTLYLDLADVNFLDSSGVGAVVFLFKRVRAVGGSLHILNVRGQPLELMSLLRVGEAIPLTEFSDNKSQPTASMQ